MRKHIINVDRPRESLPLEGPWLELDRIASVEITSEAAAHPVEGALLEGGAGWKAAAPGEQMLRLAFDTPQRVRRIFLEIDEPTTPRTQEMALAWSNGDGERREIVRQRWNFSPDGSTRELEDYRVELEDVRVLEISLKPDLERNAAVASLTRLRLA
jgi:hypothetical protein